MQQIMEIIEFIDDSLQTFTDTIAQISNMTEIVPEILYTSVISLMDVLFILDNLKHLKKTAEDLKKDWTPDAEKRAKVQLIITKIALEEKIEADPELVKREVENLLKTYKDATEDRTKAYVEMMLTNEKVLEWLENQK